jgi:hypothetical protein
LIKKYLSRISPDFQVGLRVEICRQLLDEREQHWLMQGAVGLAEQLLGVDLLAQLDHQQQVGGRERLLERLVQLALVHKVENGRQLRLRVDARLRRLRPRVQVGGMFAQRAAYRFTYRLARCAHHVFLQAEAKIQVISASIGVSQIILLTESIFGERILIKSIVGYKEATEVSFIYKL